MMRRSRSLTMLWMLLTATCGACSVYEPDQLEVDAPADVDDAAQMIVGEWSARLGLDLPAELPPIRWFEGECLTWTYLPEPHDCTQGRYFEGSPLGDEQIQALTGPNLFNTSLAHELLHWSLGKRRGTGMFGADPWHNGPEWAQVPDVQVALCEYLNPGAGCEVASPDTDHDAPPPADTNEPESDDRVAGTTTARS